MNAVSPAVSKKPTQPGETLSADSTATARTPSSTATELTWAPSVDRRPVGGGQAGDVDLADLRRVARVARVEHVDRAGQGVDHEVALGARVVLDDLGGRLVELAGGVGAGRVQHDHGSTTRPGGRRRGDAEGGEGVGGEGGQGGRGEGEVTACGHGRTPAEDGERTATGRRPGRETPVRRRPVRTRPALRRPAPSARRTARARRRRGPCRGTTRRRWCSRAAGSPRRRCCPRGRRPAAGR